MSNLPQQPLIPQLLPPPVREEPPQQTKIWLPIAALVVLLGIVLYLSLPKAEDAPPLPLSSPATVTAKLGGLEKTLRLTGSTSSFRIDTVRGPHLPGRRGQRTNYRLRIKELAPHGAHVHRGDVLVEFDREDMKNRFEDYASTVIQHEARVRKLRALLQISGYNHDLKLKKAAAAVEKSKLDLRTIPVRSAMVGERLQLLHEESEAYVRQLAKETPLVRISEGSAVRLAEMDLKEAELERRRAERNLSRMVVHSASDGIFVLRNVFRGGQLETVREGDLIGTGEPFAQIVDMGYLVVESSVNQVDAHRIRIGAPATVHFDALPDLALAAHIHSMGTIARARRRGTGYVSHVPVRLKLDETDPSVLPQATVSADVVVERAEKAVIVPINAVFFDETGGPPFAFVLGESGWERRELALGLENNIEVVVLSGLAEGERVSLQQPPGTGDENTGPHLD